MKKLCRLSKQDLMKWADGELDRDQATLISGHLEGCVPCQHEVEVYRQLNGFLRAKQKDLEVSRGFETAFWEKVSERQGVPWFERLLNGLEDLLPTPNFRQAVAFAVLAFFIGNVGGIASNFGQGAIVSTPPASTKHFTGLQEFRGIAPYSLAGAYLSNLGTEETE